MKAAEKEALANKANPIEEVHGCLFDNFHTAYDALDLKSSKTTHIEWIMRGIELTKGMQSAIVRVGTSIIAKN
jgi:hypothetical protein